MKYGQEIDIVLKKAKSDFQKVNVKIRIKKNPYFVTLKKNINLRIKKTFIVCF